MIINIYYKTSVILFNIFIREKIPKTLRQFNPIRLPYKNGKNYNEYEVEIF